MSKRGFAITINNYTDEDIADFMSITELPQVKYAICGFEVGESGTPHIQGYIYCPQKIAPRKVRSILRRAHVEPIKGSFIENMCYSSKDLKFWEYGVRPHQGKRSDLDFIGNLIRSGTSMKDIAQEYPNQFFFHHRGFKAMRELVTDYDTQLIMVPPVNDRADIVGTARTIAEYMRCEDTQRMESYSLDEILIAYFSKRWQYIIVPYTELLKRVIDAEILANQCEIKYKMI